MFLYSSSFYSQSDCVLPARIVTSSLRPNKQELLQPHKALEFDITKQLFFFIKKQKLTKQKWRKKKDEEEHEERLLFP